MSFKKLLLLGVLTYCTGCTKVINVDIEDAEKKYVIQGNLSDVSDSCEVFISQTLNISDPSRFIGIEHAVVTLSEKGGKSYTLNPGYSGKYTYPVKGVPGKTYDLTVKIDGHVFTSSSTMPQKVPIDSVFLINKTFLGNPRIIAAITFSDPPGLGNYYRFFQLVDGETSTAIYIMKDNLIDGNTCSYELDDYADANYSLRPDDNVIIRMRCIDYNNYLFLWSLSQESLGGGGAASPGNPVTNISGGALGYFSAHTSELSESVHVPKSD